MSVRDHVNSQGRNREETLIAQAVGMIGETFGVQPRSAKLKVRTGKLSAKVEVSGTVSLEVERGVFAELEVEVVFHEGDGYYYTNTTYPVTGRLLPTKQKVRSAKELLKAWEKR